MSSDDQKATTKSCTPYANSERCPSGMSNQPAARRSGTHATVTAA